MQLLQTVQKVSGSLPNVRRKDEPKTSVLSKEHSWYNYYSDVVEYHKVPPIPANIIKKIGAKNPKATPMW